MVDGEDNGTPVRVPCWLDQSTAIAWRLLVFARAVYVTAFMLCAEPTSGRTARITCFCAMPA